MAVCRRRFPASDKVFGRKGKSPPFRCIPPTTTTRPGESGKAEAWFIVSCPQGAELIYDINCTKQEFASAVISGKIEDKLRRLAVHPGDVLDIPPGTVHALTAGIVIYEVQQNADTTYRLYDWDRVDPKNWQITAARHCGRMRVIKHYGRGTLTGSVYNEIGGARTIYIPQSAFHFGEIEINGDFTGCLV